MLKIHVVAGTISRGRAVAILKLAYSMTSIFSAEKPCKADMYTRAKMKSNFNLDLSCMFAGAGPCVSFEALALEDRDDGCVRLS